MTSGLVWICCRELSHPVPSHMLTVRKAGCNCSAFNRVAIPPCSTLLLHGGTGIFIAILLYLFSGLDLLLWSTNPAQPPAAESSLLGSKIPQGKRQGIIYCDAWLCFIEKCLICINNKKEITVTAAVVLLFCVAVLHPFSDKGNYLEASKPQTPGLCDLGKVLSFACHLFLPLILTSGDSVPHHREKNIHL